jgi:hypothetical protein
MNTLQRVRLLLKLQSLLGSLQSSITQFQEGKINMLQLVPSILAVLAAAGSAFSPQLQGFFSHHAMLSGTLLSVFALVNHWLPAPGSSNAPPK